MKFSLIILLLLLLLLFLLPGIIPAAPSEEPTPEQLEQKALRNLEEAEGLASDIRYLAIDCASLEECEEVLEEIGNLAWEIERLIDRAIGDLKDARKLRSQTSSSSL